MFVASYKYEVGTTLVNGAITIDGIDRSGYTYSELGSKLDDYLQGLELGNKVALLYVGGPAIHHSDSRVVKGVYTEGAVVVKSQLGYGAYTIARKIPGDVDFVSINTNTCASALYSLYEAKGLFDKGYTDIVIYGADIVDEAQKLLFTQLGIDLVCGDGVVAMHLTGNPTGVEIPEVIWTWNKDSSPMSVSSEGYKKVLLQLDGDVDIVKVHGSGTDRNTKEEESAIREILNDVKLVEHKSKIGHTQGISALVEMCLLLDSDVEFNSAIVLGSGLGGFYGGCKVRRLNDNSRNEVC